MNLLSSIRDKAKFLKKHIVLPEGDDRRTIDAIEQIIKEDMATVTVLTDNIDSLALELDKKEVRGAVNIINPKTDGRVISYADIYYNMRKSKGITPEEALEQMKKPLFFGAMLLREGEADGCVAGAANTTSDVLKAALRVIGLKNGVQTLSSSFIMVSNKNGVGANGVLLFADCAVNPDPTSEMLVDIAVSTAETFQSFMPYKAKVALLSFSTKGSAASDSVKKVQKAAELLRENHPDLLADGELQADSAIIPEVAELKDKNGLLHGKANVLIFPNLDAANISYKLVQRFADAQAIGPVIQGLKKPMNDLSRGCSVQDIVNTVAVTLVQAGGK